MHSENVSDRRCGRPGARSGKTWARGVLRRFRNDQDGAAAEEFALVALPFLALLFAILETAVMFWTSTVLETAVADATRQLYTGQFQQDPGNSGKTSAQLQANFKKLVCDNVNTVFDCTSMLQVDVRTFASFSSATVPSPITNGQFDSSGFDYQAPGSNQIVVVRAAMEYPILVQMTRLSNLSNGNRLIMASAAFRTEPF